MDVFAPLLKTSFLPDAELAALTVVEQDRQKYAAVNTTILDYCREARLILSDRNVLAGSTDDPMIIYDYRIAIYTAYPVFHANALVNMLYTGLPESKARTILRVKTVRYGEELHIEYDTRIMAIIYKLQAHHGDEPYAVVRPVEIGGQNYFPPEIELIDICYSQYNPARRADRDRDAEYFTTFYEQADRRRAIVKGGGLRSMRKISKTGAYKLTVKGEPYVAHDDRDNISLEIDEIDAKLADDHDDMHDIDHDGNGQVDSGEYLKAKTAGDCRDLRKQLVEGLKVSIVTDFIPAYNADAEEPLVLLGVWAVNFMRHGKALCANPEKVQIVGQISPEKLLAALRKYTGKFSKAPIVMRNQNLHIPKDFRTLRTTYYMAVAVDRRTVEKPFLDLFNCAEFECVPYTRVDLLCLADPWMIMRFLLVDMWIVRMIYSMDLIGADIFKKKMDELWAAFVVVHGKREAREKSALRGVESSGVELREDLSEAELYEDSQESELCWTGVFRNAKVDKKIADQQSKRAIPYYPEMYAATHDGQLREISKG